MDIRRLGARSLANLAYAFLISGRIDAAIRGAERTRDGGYLDQDEREQVAKDTISDFDVELVTRYGPGLDSERVRRARENARAFSQMRRAMELAAESE